MSSSNPPRDSAAPPSNFLRQIIDDDMRTGKWGGRVATRFPPEPNGYLHIGHAKSICLNFGLARDYNGVCHLRFDDTNPVKEDQEYVDSILDAVRWLGFRWGTDREGDGDEHLYYASDYFDRLYEFGEHLIRKGRAYVDSLTADQTREYRGSFTEPGRESPYRERTVEENLDLFRRMKAGEFPDGAHVLRAKIDMGSPNLNMRDPVIYRIRHAHHHRTGDKWCIYPMYDYTHCISDALERITHSICTLEFEDHRPLYDWVLDELADVLPWHSRQYEFARLNVTYVITSKRKLKQLVDEGHVSGWNDPRMPTLVGIRRRGFTPESIRLFCDRVGVAKADQWIDYGVLEAALRDDLEPKALRVAAVLDPLKLVIDNFPVGLVEECTAPAHPQRPELGRRSFPISRELWIERDDFSEAPPKGYFRLFPGNRVRLRHGYVIECKGVDRDAAGQVTAVHADYFPDSKSGTDGANTYKVKGNIHWVSAAHALPVEVRLYDRLFTDPQPDSGHKSFLEHLNPHSNRTITAYVEPGVGAGPHAVQPEDRVQFERHGYFVADHVDSRPGKPVFNRIVTLKDTWQTRT
ncbi:MAG: glutamine--tRNA ligase/YqeY domain fusion protein [Burkholderiales bacterium]|nr:glutamine--tRNA ligase/YqeY domain fusion protein [Burkholderiales bacterium]